MRVRVRSTYCISCGIGDPPPKDAIARQETINLVNCRRYKRYFFEDCSHRNVPVLGRRIISYEALKRWVLGSPVFSLVRFVLIASSELLIPFDLLILYQPPININSAD